MRPVCADGATSNSSAGVSAQGGCFEHFERLAAREMERSCSELAASQTQDRQPAADMSQPSTGTPAYTFRMCAHHGMAHEAGTNRADNRQYEASAEDVRESKDDTSSLQQLAELDINQAIYAPGKSASRDAAEAGAMHAKEALRHAPLAAR